MNEPGCSTVREIRADRMNEAINRVEDLASRLQDFVDKISNDERPKGTHNDNQKRPSLFDVLSEGPARIHAACDQIDSDINRAREMLF